MKNGTLVRFNSWGSTYNGFIVGECSYDNCGENNGYVVRYVWRINDEAPRKPYTIVDKESVKPVEEFPEDFLVGDHWSKTPADRCTEWELKKDESTNYLMVVPLVKNEQTRNEVSACGL
jgi:hypothetical protein